MVVEIIRASNFILSGNVLRKIRSWGFVCCIGVNVFKRGSLYTGGGCCIRGSRYCYVGLVTGVRVVGGSLRD